MERREKTDFILEQMRLCLLRKDYTRVQIISKKISQRFFEQEENNVSLFIYLFICLFIYLFILYILYINYYKY